MRKQTNYTVYKHVCPNGKVYIGVTMQKTYKRWRGGMGYYDNPHFFRAIVKYGWDNIKHEILYEGLSEEDAFRIEKQLVAEYKSNNFAYGYNRSMGGRYSNEGCHTKREVHRVKKMPKGDKAYQAKQIAQFNLKGKLIRIWGSGVTIAKHLHIKSASLISNSCKFRQITAYGYIWLYADEKDRINEKLEMLPRGRTASSSKRYSMKMSKLMKEKYQQSKDEKRRSE
jgi:hypothetical protein